MYLIYPLLIWFSGNDLMARSLKASADKLASETTKIGMALSIFGISLAGIYYVMGKGDAANKMSAAAFGAVALTLSPDIINFIKGLA